VAGTPELLGVQVPPPFAEVRMVPDPLVGALPTTTHPPLLQDTPSRVTVTPDVWAVQVAPPLVLPKITPVVPTATHSLPEHDTPSRVAVEPEVCGSQV
jgi:hypothetical protein